MPSSQFQQQAQLFFYKGVGGKSIQIDITPDWQVSSVTSFHCKQNIYLWFTVSLRSIRRGANIGSSIKRLALYFRA
jgi:hypothetical protein